MISKRNISKNIIANTVGKVWTVVISLVFVPIYIKLLGEEAYGIVTFFAVLQSVLNIMGVGLQKTLRREFADTGSNIDTVNQKKYKLLRSTEAIYFFICLIIIVICWAGSNAISTRWLNYSTLNPQTVATTIALMGGSIGLQLIANLYAGGIYGLDLQSLANLLQVVWMTVKNAGVIIVLLLVSRDLIPFYIWMVLVDLLYCILLRVILIKKIPVSYGHQWRISDFSNIKGIWRYAAGLFVISVGSALNTQLDKIIMSKYLPIVHCGAYNSAVHLGSFTAYVPSIIGTAIFSNIATLVFQNKREEAKHLFKGLNRLAVIVVSAFSAYIALFSYEIMLIWTQSYEYAEIMKYAAPMVIIGYTLNAFQQVPYDYLLASGNTKINQIQLWCCMPYVATVTVVLTKNCGVNGAATAWLIELVLSTTIYLYFFYRISFNENGIKWIIKEIYGVYLLAFLPALFIRYLTLRFELSSGVSLLIAIVCGAITLFSMMVVLERNSVLTIYNRIRKRNTEPLQ